MYLTMRPLWNGIDGRFAAAMLTSLKASGAAEVYAGRRVAAQVETEQGMNREKVVFGFFILFAATLNFGFVLGEIGNPDHHNIWEFYAAMVVNLIATVLKFGDRTHIGAVHFAASLVALIQLAAAAVVWFFAPVGAGGLISTSAMVGIVSLSAGALLANIVSVIIMIVETTMQRR